MPKFQNTHHMTDVHLKRPTIALIDIQNALTLYLGVNVIKIRVLCFLCSHYCDLLLGWMIINCAFGCNACHLRDARARCSRERLNTTNTNALVPGQLNAIFERIEQNQDHQFGDITVLSRDPWIIEFANFVPNKEAQALLSTVHEWERSTDTGQMNKFGEQGRILSSSRTSSNAWCRADCENHPDVKNLLSRIEFTTTVPIRNYESFQVLHYENSQYYRTHHDTGMDEMNLACGPRILTFFLYLSDVEEGGETAFPRLNIAVKPKRGSALLWANVMSNNPALVDMRTSHEARPVIKGVKLAANSWIHQYDFVTPNLWGCTGSFD
jgi:prolyl 4-hydroxylase